MMFVINAGPSLNIAFLRADRTSFDYISFERQMRRQTSAYAGLRLFFIPKEWDDPQDISSKQRLRCGEATMNIESLSEVFP